MVNNDVVDSPGARLAAGYPSVLETLAIVRDALAQEVRPHTADRAEYVVRMACRLIEIALRELDDQTGSAAEIAARIRATGATDESEIASGLLNGRFDPTDQRVRAVVQDLVRWRIAIARPDYLEQSASPSQGNAIDLSDDGIRRRSSTNKQQGVTP